MSLIADALKAAQKARAGDSQAETRARRVVAAGNAPIRVKRPIGHDALPRSVLTAAGMLVTALAVLLAVVLFGPRAAPPVLAAPEGTTGPVEQPRTTSQPPAVATVVEDDPAPETARVQRPSPAGPDRPVRQEETVAAPPPVASVTVDEPSPRFRLTVEPAPAADELFRRGVAAHRRGALEEAVRYYRQAVEQTPDDAEIVNNLGTAYRSLGRLADAETHFRRAVALNPAYAAAWSNLGVVLDALGREDEAVAAYREALRQDPANAGAKINLAQAYHGLGMAEQAAALLREVLNRDPASPEAHYALARVLDEQQDRVAAARHYEAFLTTSGGQFPALEQAVQRRLAALQGRGAGG